MATRSVKGLRCRARWQMRTHVGIIDALCEGTIVAEMDNLGRRLFEVRWDNDVRAYVFPDEIEILGERRESDRDKD